MARVEELGVDILADSRLVGEFALVAIGAYLSYANFRLRRRFKEARWEATHDKLTGLLNRRGLENEFKRLSSSIPEGFSLISVDLDDLKIVNDSLGHIAGDELLVSAAHILGESIRQDRDEPDVAAAARFGGDEFALLLVGATDQDAIDRAIERIRQNLELNGIRASMGGCVHTVGQDLTTLSHAADVRLYNDKSLRKPA